MQKTNIVYTTMFADLFHRGHVEFIKRIKNTGDFLIVGLPPDDVVSYFEGRVIIPFEDRKALLEAISLVDMVIEDCMTLRSPTTIDNLIRFKANTYTYSTRQPAYTSSEVRKRKLCKVVKVEHNPHRATTELLQKIRKMTTVAQVKRPVVVYTYVCGDLLHEGHLLYLENAKALGEKLIVGVLTDEAIMEKKPKPTMVFRERLVLVKSLDFVDCVVPQNTYSPDENVKAINPDILVESSSHLGNAYLDILKTQFSGKIVVFPYYTEQSSTAIKNRIRRTK